MARRSGCAGFKWGVVLLPQCLQPVSLQRIHLLLRPVSYARLTCVGVKRGGVRETLPLRWRLCNTSDWNDGGKRHALGEAAAAGRAGCTSGAACCHLTSTAALCCPPLGSPQDLVAVKQGVQEVFDPGKGNRAAGHSCQEHTPAHIPSRFASDGLSRGTDRIQVQMDARMDVRMDACK